MNHRLYLDVEPEEAGSTRFTFFLEAFVGYRQRFSSLSPRLGVHKAAQAEPGADHQHQAHRHLRCYEDAVQARFALPAPGVPSFKLDTRLSRDAQVYQKHPQPVPHILPERVHFALHEDDADLTSSAPPSPGLTTGNYREMLLPYFWT